MLLAAVSPKLDSPAAALLAECGAQPAEVREQVMRMVLEQSPELAGAISRQSWLSRLTSTTPLATIAGESRFTATEETKWT